MQGNDHDLDKYLEDLGISTEEEDERLLTSLGEDEEPMLAAFTAGMVVEGDTLERLESFLVNLLLHLDPAYAVEIERLEDDCYAVEIFGGDPGKIIGRGGRTLAALEYLTNTFINRDEAEGRVRVSIDVGGYKRRRDDRLRQEAQRAAAKVRKSGMAVELAPMSAAERRIIHLTLANDPAVMSESSGEGKNRRVVVKPRTEG